MNLNNIIAVSGLPGLYKLITTRNNGLVVADLEKGKSQFCSVRKHQFTPLETVSIYTYKDSVEISKVFQTMIQQEQEGNAPIEVKSSNLELMEYFESILPEYDDDKVYPKDVKKIIKWYNELKKFDLLTSTSDEEE